jgi:hypothetical protein
VSGDIQFREIHARHNVEAVAMQSAILEKLTAHLGTRIDREADVVYLLVEIGKFLEQEAQDDRYPLLRFYRNWVAHSWIGNLNRAKHIPAELNNAIASYSLTGNEQLAIGWIKFRAFDGPPKVRARGISE